MKGAWIASLWRSVTLNALLADLGLDLMVKIFTKSENLNKPFGIRAIKK